LTWFKGIPRATDDEQTLIAFVIAAAVHDQGCPDAPALDADGTATEPVPDLTKQFDDRERRIIEQSIGDVRADLAAGKRPTVTGKSAKPRRQRQRKSAELTQRQAETVQIAGECRGNIAEAARRLGRHRATVDESYNAAMKKLGTSATQAKRIVRSPEDQRGQSMIASADDGPASLRSNSKATRDRRRE